MAGTRTHALPHGVAVDRTAESATAVLRDWDVHITTILDDQGEVRVRAHDPRSLDAGVTMLRGNAHRALAARHYLPPPVRPAPPAPPRRRVRQFAATSAVVALLTAGAIGLRLSGDNDPGVRLVVMPAATETVTVSNPERVTTEVARPESELERPAGVPATVMAAGPPTSTTSTTALASGTPSTTRPPVTRTARFTTPAKSATPTSGTNSTPDAGTGGGQTEAPRSNSGPSLTIVTRSPSSPSGPWSCANSTLWTSSGCSSGAATGQPTGR